MPHVRALITVIPINVCGQCKGGRTPAWSARRRSLASRTWRSTCARTRASGPSSAMSVTSVSRRNRRSTFTSEYTPVWRGRLACLAVSLQGFVYIAIMRLAFLNGSLFTKIYLAIKNQLYHIYDM